MSWSIVKQQRIYPNFEMVDDLIKELNGVFDARDFYHHSSTKHEMFEFTYQKDDFRRESWQITFMDKVVASGGGFGLDYDDFYEEDYVFLIDDNRQEIYQKAYNGAIGYISDILKFVSFADIQDEEKLKWIDVIKNGMTK